MKIKIMKQMTKIKESKQFMGLEIPDEICCTGL